MRRREFIGLLGTGLTWPIAAPAQQAGRTYRLGALYATPRNDVVVPVFFEAMRRLGFIEGQNLMVDYRDAYVQHIEKLSEWAAELVKARVDVVTTVGDLGIRAAQDATKTIPILAITDDMVGAGLVNSMARPNGNTTGVCILATELDGKRQEILIEAVPGVRRMAAIADSSTLTEAKARAQEAARAHNVELLIHRVASGDEIAAVIDMAKSSGATALNVLASPMLYASRQTIMDRVAALCLPTMFIFPNRRRKAARLPMDRGSSSCGEMFYLDSSRSSCAGPRSLTSQSSSRPSSSW